MWTIKEMKERGKAAFNANYWYCVLVSLIFTVCAGGSGGSAGSSARSASSENPDLQSALSDIDPTIILVIAAFIAAMGVTLIIGSLVDIFLFNPLKVGCFAFFSRNVRNTPASLNELKEGFHDYTHKVLGMFLKSLFIFLWGLLFIIPGIVKSYSYKMVPYILADNPGISAMEAITRSREMMNGNKGRAFLLDLSFFWWILLTIITCGLVGIFYVNPYIASTHGALYEELKGQDVQGIQDTQDIQSPEV